MIKTGTCDGCQAGADTDVYLPDGRLLELCDSHAKRHQSALRRQGALMIGHSLVEAPATAMPYEGIAFEREFRRLARSAASRSAAPRNDLRTTPSAFLHSSEQVRVQVLGSVWRRAWLRLSGQTSRHRQPGLDGSR
jgi:hypothetical protein